MKTRERKGEEEHQSTRNDLHLVQVGRLFHSVVLTPFWQYNSKLPLDMLCFYQRGQKQGFQAALRFGQGNEKSLQTARRPL